MLGLFLRRMLAADVLHVTTPGRTLATYVKSSPPKTPTNRAKKWAPATVPVTKANGHLIVALEDESQSPLGTVPLSEAKQLAESKQLKLVIVDEACKPPRFRLMSGAELFKLQMQYKSAEGAQAAEEELAEAGKRPLKDKEVHLGLGIEDNDFEIKMRMLNEFYERGHSVSVEISGKLPKWKKVNGAAMLKELIERVAKATGGRARTVKSSESGATLHVASKYKK